MRELIAAYTLYQNQCGFCANSHASAASALLGDETLVWDVLRDLEGSPLPEKEKVLLRFVGKVTTNLPAVQRDDVAALQAAGWDDEAIYYAITTCALFNFYNRWITATGVPECRKLPTACRVSASRRTATCATEFRTARWPTWNSAQLWQGFGGAAAARFSSVSRSSSR